MAKRRTIASIEDIIGNPVRPGDVVAIAVSQAMASGTSALRLVEVTTIYLDDAKGDPYFDGPVLFRDPGTDILRKNPTDNPWSAPSRPVAVPDASKYVVVRPKHPIVGSDYTGVAEVVAPQSWRVQGQPLEPDGSPRGKRATYEPWRILLVQTGGRPMTAAELAARAGA